MNIELKEIESKDPGKRFKYEIHADENTIGELETEVYEYDDGRESLFVIYKLVIFFNYRRQGYGSEIIRICVEMARELNLDTIYVRPKAIDRINPIGEDEVRKFYVKNGFVLDQDPQLMYKRIKKCNLQTTLPVP